MRLLVIAALAVGGCGRSRTEIIPTVRVTSIDAGGALAPESRGAASSPTFATYNVHWLTDPAGVREDLQRLDDVSVWAFQEVRGTFNELTPARLSELLPAGKWYIAWIPLNRLRELNSSDFEGQAIASRYPISSASTWELRPDGKRRVALAAFIDIERKPVMFVNTDHQPSILSARRDNVRQTNRLIKELRENFASITVVAGDFNTAGSMLRLVSARGDRSELRRKMVDIGFSPAMDDSSRTFHAGAYSATLDHIFVRGTDISASGVDEFARGSDHRPVWCRIDLNVTANLSTSQSVSPVAP